MRFSIVHELWAKPQADRDSSPLGYLSLRHTPYKSSPTEFSGVGSVLILQNQTLTLDSARPKGVACMTSLILRFPTPELEHCNAT